MAGRIKETCSCGNLQESKGVKNGIRYYGKYCTSCRKNPYRRDYPREVCVMCGFIPEIPSQMDIDHIDGNHNNNDKNNLQVLCANCHRLKTYRNQDWSMNPVTI